MQACMHTTHAPCYMCMQGEMGLNSDQNYLEASVETTIPPPTEDNTEEEYSRRYSIHSQASRPGSEQGNTSQTGPNTVTLPPPCKPPPLANSPPLQSPPPPGRPSLPCFSSYHVLCWVVLPICFTHGLALLSHYFK